MSSPPADAAHARRIGYDAFESFSKLFTTYCSRFDELSEYYRLDVRDPGDRVQAVRDAAHHPRDRETLVRVLREQQDLWGSDAAARANVERLLDTDSAVVVTGQQVGILTGPLYTVLKALTTVLVARALEQESGQPVVPVFWLGSEDHDLDEMATTALPDGVDTEWLTYAGHQVPDGGNLGPVGPLVFTDDIERLVDRVDELLPPSDFHDEVMRAVRAAYRTGATFRDAFGSLLRWMLPETGLVLMAADHPELKRLTAPLWRREIEDWSSADAALRQTSERLEAGFHAQVHIRPTNLFVLHEGQRLPLDVDGGDFVIRGTQQRYSKAEALALLASEPERFSPNVVLRPLTQDHLLPTAAYVAGPGETAYFAQYRSVYEWAGIPMPLIYPRASVTLVESRIRRTLDKLGHEVSDFEGDIEPLFTALVKEQLGVDVDAAFGRATGEIHRLLGALKPVVGEVDRSLGKTVEATRASLVKEIERLKEKVVRSERRNQDVLRGQVDKVVGALFPSGKPQERALSPLYFLDKYGPDFFVRLMDTLSDDTDQHWIVDL